MKWFLLLTKRNFKKPSFIFILLLIPCVTLALMYITSRDTSVMHIGYTCEDEPTESTDKLFHALEENDGILAFKHYPDKGSGEKAIQNGEIESLWVFPADIEAKTKEYFSGNKAPLVKVINREQTEMTEASRDRLFCQLFPYIAYSVFESYMTEELPGGNTLSEEELRYYYTLRGIDEEIINVVTVNSLGEIDQNRGNYITSPLRGILAVVVLLSALAGAMYTLLDIQRGLFVLFSFKKRIFLYFCSLMSCVVPASVTAVISVYFAGLGEGVAEEVSKMTLFALACVLMSLAMMPVLKTPKAFAVSVPIITILAIIFSPVFMNMNSFLVIQGLFPTYYYLYSFTDTTHILYLALYTLICGAISVPLFKKM
ncbi:MAG: ABC transporter permease [Ruminococcaceae bacterium]|nr:ABC transporter permease [Oscillospiraceae bacterium]